MKPQRESFGRALSLSDLENTVGGGNNNGNNNAGNAKLKALLKGKLNKLPKGIQALLGNAGK